MSEGESNRGLFAEHFAKFRSRRQAEADDEIEVSELAKPESCPEPSFVLHHGWSSLFRGVGEPVVAVQWPATGPPGVSANPTKSTS